MKKSMLWLLEPDKTPSNAFELLRGGLAVFSDLKRFELKPSWAWERKIPPDFKEATPELSRFDLWTESCRSLEEVRLFGTVLRGA
ncbi:hypothetical protein FRC07_013918 [Ceratobasidium sp. 392]|nr:hypothetical protein FRC07_013918 [Ceratobasidium sp. 392]